MFRVSLALLFGVFLLGAAGCMLGSKLVAPANHPVPLPADFQAEVVSIAGPGYRIAGWWVDSGAGTPVVLLLHAVRADRSSMVSRAELLVGHGWSQVAQQHGNAPIA